MTKLMHAGACDVKNVCCKRYETSTDMETRSLCSNSQWLINVEQISQWSIRGNETRFLLSDQSIEGAEEEIYTADVDCMAVGRLQSLCLGLISFACVGKIRRKQLNAVF